MGSRVDVDLQFDMWVCVREHIYFDKVKAEKKDKEHKICMQNFQ